jgi:hypothetical protein
MWSPQFFDDSLGAKSRFWSTLGRTTHSKVDPIVRLTKALLGGSRLVAETPTLEVRRGGRG